MEENIDTRVLLPVSISPEQPSSSIAFPIGDGNCCPLDFSHPPQSVAVGDETSHGDTVMFVGLICLTAKETFKLKM